MKLKALSLIFLVVFAAVATSVVLCLSSSQIVEENNGFSESYSIVQVDGEVDVEPDGKALDTPGMPG